MPPLICHCSNKESYYSDYYCCNKPIFCFFKIIFRFIIITGFFTSACLCGINRCNYSAYCTAEQCRNNSENYPKSCVKLFFRNISFFIIRKRSIKNRFGVSGFFSAIFAECGIIVNFRSAIFTNLRYASFFKIRCFN